MEKREQIIIILFISLVLLFTGGFLLFAMIWYRKRTNRYIRERESMQAAFESQLLQATLEMQEQTLNEVSREIHDSIGQDLSLTKMQLNIIEVSEGLSKDVLQGARESLSKAVVQLRDMARSMSTDRIKNFDLSIAIAEEMERIQRTSLLACRFEKSGTEKPLADGKKLILFRIIQECLQNSMKHAEATEAVLQLDYGETSLEIDIRDNGKGFNVREAIMVQNGMGIQNIINRAEVLGGKAFISSTLGEGTAIIIKCRMNRMTYITVVDDHVMFRRGLVHLINLFPDYRVLFEADNGKDFISRLKPASMPDIVLLDINMPEMDGYATAKWLKVNYPEVKVLTLSMLDSETSIIKMIQNGSRGYILKDADTDELKLAFKEVMEKGYFYNDVVSRKLLHSIHELVNAKNEPAGFRHITDRELQFMRLACSDKTYREIAAEMFLSERTIDGYRESLFKKLDVASRVGLAIYAIKNGLVQI